MELVTEQLRALSDPAYADFQAKLTPTLPRDVFLGVRVPVLRGFAKAFAKTPECGAFLEELPHRYYDENMLHGLVLTGMKDYAECLRRVEAFLPFVDNWAVCDTLSPKAFASHREELLDRIRQWSASPLPYTCRFGIEMLQTHFLDGAFRPELLEIPASVESGEYYVNMMVAWFFATALAKQWDHTVPYLEEGRLSAWVQNKTIQKAVESYRIPQERKDYLRTLKRKKDET